MNTMHGKRILKYKFKHFTIINIMSVSLKIIYRVLTSLLVYYKR